MSLQENLKMFYLGLSNNTPYMYKNADLTTHAMIVGMSGSGKTGLGIALLEEAMIDNIPSFVIDPKGDLTNLALSFSKLKADEFAPFVDENEMQTLEISRKNLAEQKAQIWQNGLQNSYQSKERIKLLKDSSDVRIYTPKSDSGLQLSLLSDFIAPDLDDEALNEYVKCAL